MGPPTFLHNMHNYQNTDQAFQKTPKKPKIYFQSNCSFGGFSGIMCKQLFFKIVFYTKPMQNSTGICILWLRLPFKGIITEVCTL